MTHVDLGSEAHEKYREAGDVLATVMGEVEDMVEPGTTHLEVAEYAEDRIDELGGEPAFPVNISVDEEASHATPAPDDGAEFDDGMVCLDIGVHVDGWIADAAKTIDLSGTPDLVEAAEAALEAALDVVEPGAHTGQVGTAIEEAIAEYDYNPIVNLSGHGLAHYDAHTEPNVPNRAAGSGVEFEPGMVFAIEPFATTGSGKVNEGSKTQIYEVLQARSVRDRRARQLLEELIEEYQGLPFAKRWLSGSRLDVSLRRLERADVIRSYPVLKEEEGTLVSQAEHTVIVTGDGCEVTTDGIF